MPERAGRRAGFATTGFDIDPAKTDALTRGQSYIDAVSSSGSFLDGGGSKPLQRSTIPLLAPDYEGLEEFDQVPLMVADP